MLFSKICAIFSATSPAHHGITVWNGGEVQCSSSHAPKLILSPPVCCQCALLIRSWHQNRRSEGMSRTVQLIHIFLTFMEQNIVLMIDIRQSHFRFHLFFIDISEDIPRCFFFYCLPMSISLTTLMKVKNSADGIYTYPMDPSIELYCIWIYTCPLGNIILDCQLDEATRVPKDILSKGTDMTIPTYLHPFL